MLFADMRSTFDPKMANDFAEHFPFILTDQQDSDYYLQIQN